jgi:N-acetylmuramoyl-L-alanine amidase
VSKLIALSDGHGIDTAGKRTPTLPNGQKSEIGRPYMNENLFNRAVVKYLDELLRENGFRTLLVAPTDADTSLATRTNEANKAKADLYVSVHANALAGKWGNHGGIETFTWGSGDSLKLGKLVHAELLKGSPLKDRKVKDGSHLWEIRKPTMPSILVEAGFMDSHNDYKYLLSDAYRRECAIEIATGICKYYGVTFKNTLGNTESKPTPTPSKPVAKPSGAKTHTVEKGETFYSIAKEHGMDAKTIMSYNPRVPADKLKVGDVIHLIPVVATETKPVEKPKPTPAPKPVVETTPSNVYGVITVKVANLNVRADANFNSKIVKTIQKGEQYKVYSQKNGLYNLGGNQWCSAGSDFVSFTKNTAHKIETKRLQVIVSQLYTYKTANWNNKGQIVKKNEVYTIAKELTVDGAKMYQLKSGLFISANPKYVKLV